MTGPEDSSRRLDGSLLWTSLLEDWPSLLHPIKEACSLNKPRGVYHLWWILGIGTIPRSLRAQLLQGFLTHSPDGANKPSPDTAAEPGQATRRCRTCTAHPDGL